MADSLSSRINSAQSFLDREGDNLWKYHGGMPVGFMAAIAQHESDGNFNSSGDASLGEVGYFQVASDTGPKFGVDASVRTYPEGNIFLAALEYQVNAARIVLNYGSYVGNGTVDQWKFARLIFAIGWGGTTGLLNRAIAANAIGSYSPYDDFVRWAQNGGASGTQLNRIVDIQTQWAVGQSVSADGPGVPTEIPQLVPYTLPTGIEFDSNWLNMILAGMGLVLVLFLGDLL